MGMYFVYLNNSVAGPFSQEVLIKMYSNRTIGPATQVSMGKGTPWKKFSEYQELYSAAFSQHNMSMQHGYTPNATVQAVSQQPSTTRPAVAQPVVAQAAIAQPAVVQAAVAQPVVAQAAISQPVVAQAAIAQPAIAQPVVAQAAIAQPAVVQAATIAPPVLQAATPQAANQVKVVKVEQKEDAIFFCPKCNQKFSGDPSWLGQEVVCNSCDAVFIAGSTEELACYEDDGISETLALGDPNGDLICPHCWLRFSSEQLLYIASHPALIGDPVLGPGAMKRFSPTAFNANGQALDAMSYVATEMACPRCRLKIPATVIDEKSLYFSIVGAPSSGKSYYLATLLHSLRKHLASDFACSLIDVDPELNMVLDEYEETLFRNKRSNELAMLPKTEQTGDRFTSTITIDNIQVYLPKPFIFELKHLSGEDSDRDCNIIFYDNAGEHFAPGSDNANNPGTRHLACSNGIVFIFDPINDALMRKFCNPAEPQLENDAAVTDQTKLLSEMILRLRRHRNMDVNEKCSVPLVIGVCKYDAWKELFEHDLSTLSTLETVENSLTMAWNRNMIMDVSFAMRELLLKHCPSLVNTAEGFFEKVIFVPFSNFGCLASQNEFGNVGVLPSQINPIWTQETFMALMAEYDVITLAPRPAPTAKLPVQIMQEFIVFKHPVDGHLVRLPYSYSGAVLTIGGETYAMPIHPKNTQTNHRQPVQQTESGNIWD